MPDTRAWLFPYVAEAVPRRDRSILRPLVPLSIGQEGSIRRWALIDTGAENVLAADWVADAAGVDLNTPLDVVRIGIGGQVADVAFHEVELGLHDPAAPAERISWRAEVGIAFLMAVPVGAAVGAAFLHLVWLFADTAHFHLAPTVLGELLVIALIIALLAGWFPARRTSRLDPTVTLRFD